MNAELTLIQRMVVGHLESLDPAFGPEADLAIVEDLFRGTPIAVIAKAVGCTAAEVADRWFQMLFPAITTDRGALTMDGRQDLIIAARVRVQRVAQSSEAERASL